MLSKKKILFVTGTRADYGKLKSLILAIKNHKKFDYRLFVTGMHNLKNYGSTYEEIVKDNFLNYFRYSNQKLQDSMDIILSKTILGFNKYITKEKPDLVVVHGDRVETLACTISCVLNNILIGHIEGGEVSGTVDEMIRHSVSKLAHLHFVSNLNSKKRLIQMGEQKNKIFIIGSPDFDIMKSSQLPSLKEVKSRYKIEFNEFGILLFHPVTTEIKELKRVTKILCNSVLKSNKKFVVIYPNNDKGSEIILKEYKSNFKNKNIKLFPSMRFEYFLTLLKNAKVIIGNSSAAVREAPFYGTKTVNLGTRRNTRVEAPSIKNLNFNQKKIIKEINYAFNKKAKYRKSKIFSYGNASNNFVKVLSKKNIFDTSKQKYFIDL